VLINFFEECWTVARSSGIRRAILYVQRDARRLFPTCCFGLSPSVRAQQDTFALGRVSLARLRPAFSQRTLEMASATPSVRSGILGTIRVACGRYCARRLRCSGGVVRIRQAFFLHAPYRGFQRWRLHSFPWRTNRRYSGRAARSARASGHSGSAHGRLCSTGLYTARDDPGECCNLGLIHD
jgi:hypothetical protein